jgi:hypothetical protein
MSYLQTLQEFSEKRGIRWDSGLVGLATFVVPAVLCFLSVWKLLDDNRLVFAAVAAAVAGLAGLGGWRWSCSPPKTPKGKVGIAFAISTESDLERRRLKADLLEAITTQLEFRTSALPFKVITVPTKNAAQVFSFGVRCGLADATGRNT